MRFEIEPDAGVTNQRNDFGVKDSDDMYRAGGERVCWLDGYVREITVAVQKRIQAAGYKAWRTGDTVWVRSADVDAIHALEMDVDQIAKECGLG